MLKMKVSVEHWRRSTMSTDRTLPRWLSIVGRVGASTLSLAALIAGVGVAVTGAPAELIRNLPGGSEELLVRNVSLTPPGRELVCVGPFLGFIPQDTTTRGFGEPVELLAGVELTSSELDSPDLFNERGLRGEDPASPITVHRQPSSEPGMGAVSRQSFATDVLRGLATAACLPAQFETWIAAGSAETGRQAVLSLANPGDVPATVDVTVYGRSGAISAPSARGILLPPGTRRVFPLTGFAPDEFSPVIHVQSQGSAVASALHTSVTRGLDADGVAIATGQFEAATNIIVPGVFVDGSDEAFERRQEPGFSDLSPSLRLLSPFEDTTAQVTVLRPGQPPVVSEARLRAGRVVDIALDVVGSGLFSVMVSADAPLVGGARVSVVTDTATDLSWVSAHPVLDEPTYMALPFGPEATLSVVAVEGDAEVTISRLSPDARRVIAQSTVRVAAGQTANRVVGVAGGAYLIETTAPIVATAVVVLSAGIGHVATAPTPPDIPPVPVIVR
jgi:hypothetical protein